MLVREKDVLDLKNGTIHFKAKFTLILVCSPIHCSQETLKITFQKAQSHINVYLARYNSHFEDTHETVWVFCLAMAANMCYNLFKEMDEELKETVKSLAKNVKAKQAEISMLKCTVTKSDNSLACQFATKQPRTSHCPAAKRRKTRRRY